MNNCGRHTSLHFRGWIWRSGEVIEVELREKKSYSTS